MSNTRKMEEINLQPKKFSKKRLSQLGKETSAYSDWYAFMRKLRAGRHAFYEKRMGALPDKVLNVWREKR